MSNICKFVESGAYSSFVVKNFVLETDVQVMKQRIVLSTHKAILFKNGKGKVLVDKLNFPFKTGMLLFAFIGENISVDPYEECEYMYIDFTGDRATQLFKNFSIDKVSRSFDGFEHLIPFWEQSLARAFDNTIDITAESMLLYAFSRIPKDLNEKKSPVNEMIDLCEKHFTDSQFCLDSVAITLGYNSKYLSHLFKQKIGITFSEYLRDTRIRYASSLIEHGVSSVKNVALLSGFSDPLYFSTVFKKCVGISPKKYVAIHLK